MADRRSMAAAAGLAILAAPHGIRAFRPLLVGAEITPVMALRPVAVAVSGSIRMAATALAAR